MIDKQVVWAKDPVEGFILGYINEILPDEAEIVPLDKKYQKRICAFDDVYPCGGDQERNKDVDDNCKFKLD